MIWYVSVINMTYIDKQFFGDFKFCFEGKAAMDSLLQSLFLVLPSESWGSLCPKMPAGRITKIPSWRNSSGCKVEASGILVYGILAWMFGKRTTRWPDIGKGHDNFQVLLTAPVSLSPENWWLEDFIPLKWSVLGIILRSLRVEDGFSFWIGRWIPKVWFFFIRTKKGTRIS